MDKNSLVAELIEAGARFLDEFEKSYPIAIAFWLKDRDESRWYLHVASDQVPDTKKKEAYGAVLRIASQLRDPNFDAFHVKLRKVSDPIVKFAIDFQRRHPGRIATQFNVPTFEGVDVEGMYLYPPGIKAPLVTKTT